ncbi:MAG TPA: D-alanyl-D-alanine carboxypeptidase [Thermoanaerobaculia bacterium]|nr:D-alanyl-D-alanine carboxypeptidase [Thermoanaerobaculia bacterium]
MKKLFAVSLLLLTACATTPASRWSTLDARTSEPPFQHALWSILVEDDDGRVLFERNADLLMIPASNRKLFASASILDCLGATTTLHTEVWRNGDDLVLRGDGDPSLGSWRYERQDDFDQLAQQLRARGITRVRDVIADVSLFDRITIPGGWKHGNIGSDYSAPVDALAWEENALPGDRAVDDAALHAAQQFREALVLRGIDVSGATRVNVIPATWQEKVADLPSPFVGELLRTVLKYSHNLYAEMLLKRAGGGTYEEAFARERSFLLAEPKLAGDTFRFVDGSGLAPDDLMTSRSAVRLLRWMNEPVRRTFWWDTLAQPNQPGTLRRRVVALEQRLRGKTGTINGVNALSGIIAMNDGRYRYFSIVINHHNGDSSAALQIIDAMVLEIAR